MLAKNGFHSNQIILTMFVGDKIRRFISRRSVLENTIEERRAVPSILLEKKVSAFQQTNKINRFVPVVIMTMY